MEYAGTGRLTMHAGRDRPGPQNCRGVSCIVTVIVSGIGINVKSEIKKIRKSFGRRGR